MPHFDIKNEHDRQQLKQLILNKKIMRDRRLHDKIEQQTQDEALADLYAPLATAIADEIKPIAQENIDSINNLTNTLQSLPAPLSLPDRHEVSPKTTNLNVDQNVLKALALNSDPKTNPKFKIEHIAANKFKFHKTPFTLVNRTMRFEDGTEFELTDNLLDALTNKKNDLKKLSAKEKTDFYLILRKTNSLVSGDHKSKRGKAILKF